VAALAAAVAFAASVAAADVTVVQRALASIRGAKDSTAPAVLPGVNAADVATAADAACGSTALTFDAVIAAPSHAAASAAAAALEFAGTSGGGARALAPGAPGTLAGARVLGSVAEPAAMPRQPWRLRPLPTRRCPQRCAR
jgi:hypothetical protein